jgi:hypothetical protein
MAGGDRRKSKCCLRAAQHGVYWRILLLSFCLMISLVVILYVIVCLLTGLYGRHRRLGFFGTSLLSFFITPLLVLIVLFFTAPADVSE